MKSLILCLLLSLGTSSAFGADEIVKAFKRTSSFVDLMNRNLGCNPTITRTLIDSDHDGPMAGSETYLLIATNSECQGSISFRYEFMRAVAMMEKSWNADKVIIKEKVSNIGKEMERSLSEDDLE